MSIASQVVQAVMLDAACPVSSTMRTSLQAGDKINFVGDVPRYSIFCRLQCRRLFVQPAVHVLGNVLSVDEEARRAAEPRERRA